MASIQSIKQRYGIIGSSELLDRALSTAIRVANTDLSVMISGESGVGKEVFSKVIHALSPRKHNNFIAINCGAIPEGTINSELFGHEKGAFTGANAERKGYFETVNGGTIFLDEIGEMPLDTQSYLLRILESGEFIRVGSSSIQKTDVRVIAATNIDLVQKVSKGKFREDLFYRLNTVPIKVPSLKERREDIFLLFRKFASDFADKYRSPVIQLDQHARLLLESYAWPGNIRELKNVAEQLSVLVEDRMITAEILVEHVPNIRKRNLPAISSSNGEDLKEREILYKLLFEMKHDLNDLKSLVFELINNNDLNVSDIKSLRQLKAAESTAKSPGRQAFNEEFQEYFDDNSPNKKEDNQPIILERSPDKSYDRMEVMDENLSIEDMEKDLISKALKKHKNRRKDAAEELGISERTLYRKIKQYEL
ncbi:MAG: transcriptional regulator with PAS, ATPase and Fis domain [Saprospiraceae bacterium]|jgi:transcriptional regulator with PAS, ATPase and Fis domain